MAFRFAWEVTRTNTAHATMHVDAELFDYSGYWLSDRVKERAKLTPEQIKLVDELEALPGVVSVSLKKRYEVSVTKGGVFPWDEIQRPVEDILGRFFGAEPEESELQQYQAQSA